jgi:group I intron endonuclease
MYYIIYKITNKLDSKIYIGAHATENINDGYMGSGKYLKRAVKKYGIENFVKDILFVFDNKEDMFSKEAEIVTESFVVSSDTYNVKLGGSGGNPGIVDAFSGRKHSDETKEKLRKSAQQQIITDEMRKKFSENNWAKKDPISHREHMKRIASMPRSSEHNRKIAEANIGKILINNDIVAKRIDKKDLVYYEHLGWKRGGMPRKK